MVIVGLVEKLENPNSWNIFSVAAKIFGIIAAVCFSVVWLPQIIQLIKIKEQGTLSLAMFLLQTPGNGIIILFQILYNQDWTTWFPYVITLAEQLTIVIILIVYRCRDRNRNRSRIDFEGLLSSEDESMDLHAEPLSIEDIDSAV